MPGSADIAAAPPVRAGSLEDLLVQFDSNPFGTSRALRQLRDFDPASFIESALRAIARQPECSSARFIATLVPLSDPVLELIANPKAFDEEAAQRIVEVMRRIDSQTESKLLRLITANPAKPLAPQLIDRILDIVDAVSDGPRLVPVLMQIYRSASPYLRARLSLSIGRHHRNKDWIEDRMRDPDPRVRANAVEANWHHKDEQAVNLFQSALRDTHHRVVGNGAVGFYYAGDVRSLRVLGEMIAHPDPNFRAAGLWAAGHINDTRFMAQIAAMSEERDIVVRRAMVVAAGRLKRAVEIREEFPRLRLRLIKATRHAIPPPPAPPPAAGEAPLRFKNHLFLEVKPPEGSAGAQPNLKTLQFHVSDNGVAILDYSVQERTSYIKPGAYDLYYTTTSSAAVDADQQTAIPHFRIDVVGDTANGTYDSDEAAKLASSAPPADSSTPADAPSSTWDAFRIKN